MKFLKKTQIFSLFYVILYTHGDWISKNLPVMISLPPSRISKQTKNHNRIVFQFSLKNTQYF